MCSTSSAPQPQNVSFSPNPPATSLSRRFLHGQSPRRRLHHLPRPRLVPPRCPPRRRRDEGAPCWRRRLPLPAGGERVPGALRRTRCRGGAGGRVPPPGPSPAPVTAVRWRAKRRRWSRGVLDPPGRGRVAGAGRRTGSARFTGAHPAPRQKTGCHPGWKCHKGQLFPRGCGETQRDSKVKIIKQNGRIGWALRGEMEGGLQHPLVSRNQRAAASYDFIHFHI